MKNENMRQWIDDFNLTHPLVIGGPCSAETETQVLKIAHSLVNTDVSIFRAGIWKPRTRPGMFEGVGAIGLKWLEKVKKETGLLTATEVANTIHVELSLKHNIDVLWIGARSTVSPFIVQEIADALKGTNKIVLLKNPVNPDLSLWLGALERLHKANIKKLGVIHRGFSTYEKTKYRNNPKWQIAIDLKKEFPNIPIICDPSHIGGRRNLIFDISQTALDLNYDGLMIETHHQPDEAWSDAKQQVTPENLVKIMKDLKIRNLNSEEEEYQNKIKKLRTEIDLIDNNLIEVFADRMNIAEKIGMLKKQKNVAVLQTGRWEKVLDEMIEEGEKQKLSKEFVLSIYKAIHQESINRQEKVINKKR